MDWMSILTTVLGLVLGSGGSLLYFRPKLAEARVSANRAQVDFLEDRIKSLGQLYTDQGKALDDVRAQVLELGRQMQAKDERITSLEAENQQLKKKVERLEKELKKNK